MFEMKIGIYGLGYVGSAVAESHKQHELVIRDPKLGDKSASIDQITKCDAVYICVPTAMTVSGDCDEEIVKSVLSELSTYTKVIISKSTIPPNSYATLQKLYNNLVHAPEFLTAAKATEDYINSSWVLIGGEERWCKSAQAIIANSSVKTTHYHFTNIQTASLFKYLANSFMATKVIFMNELFHLGNKIDVDWEEIKKISKNDTRLGISHWDVPGPDGQFGYGGACFPKDVSAIINHAANMGVNLTLLESVQHINNLSRITK